MLKVDKNYEYSVWVSYAEIYNEKIFDLLGVSSDTLASTTKNRPSAFTCSNLNLLANAPFNSGDHSNPLLIKRKALALKSDVDGKYIAGLREVRVRSTEEAKAVLKMGQINRRVFGTLANSASSRSHGIFTLKLMRVHKGSPNVRPFLFLFLSAVAVHSHTARILNRFRPLDYLSLIWPDPKELIIRRILAND